MKPCKSWKSIPSGVRLIKYENPEVNNEQGYNTRISTLLSLRSHKGHREE